MIRETGLEAGDAIDGERSRFKASSGNHSESGVTLIGTIILPSGVDASFFYVFSPKYSQCLIPEARDKKGERRIGGPHISRFTGDDHLWRPVVSSFAGAPVPRAKP